MAVQDRCTAQEVQSAIRGEESIKGLFLGGTDRFKQTALVWRNLADLMGLKFHYGRAGTLPQCPGHSQQERIGKVYNIGSSFRF